MKDLLGYDNILQDIEPDDNYIQEMCNIFKEYILNKFPVEYEYLDSLTSSLIFTMLPLHKDESVDKCRKYYKLINKTGFI